MRAAAHFHPADQIKSVLPHGGGNVNDTFLVTTSDGGKFILQRLNSQVFPKPQLIMANLRLLSDHFGKKNGGTIPAIIQTLAGHNFHIDHTGALWRALQFIDNSRNLAAIANLDQAGEAGAILARFHRLGEDINPSRLHDTLPGFHITPAYLRAYDKLRETRPNPASAEEIYCRDFIAAHRKDAAILEKARAAGILKPRPIHADPKLANIMFHKTTDKAVCLIDLDTVKPGLILYDIADLLRSICNTAGEETTETTVSFDLDICRAALTAYADAMGPSLAAADREYLQPAIQLLPFELGLRFFTDHLAGDIYFHCRYPQQNLHRAVNQFQLLTDIEKKSTAIAAILNEIRPAKRKNTEEEEHA